MADCIGRTIFFSQSLMNKTSQAIIDADALETYLGTPAIPGISDPIAYWHSLNPDKNSLARMALDILSAPDTSFYPVDNARSC